MALLWLCKPSIIFDAGKFVHILFEPSNPFHIVDIDLWDVGLYVQERRAIHYIQILNV